MKILSILTQDKASVDERKAGLAAKALKRNQEKLIDALETERIDAEAVIEQLTSGTLKTINQDTFCDELQDAKVSLGVIDAKVKIAKGTLKEWFSDSKK
tara:strand:+ start:49 stop:345 length:297 start_codon:yes stop_codon:yes gene_type:complete